MLCCRSVDDRKYQKLAHYLQQPCQDRRRVAIEKKACHVFPAKNCHFHNVVRVSMNFLYKTNSLVYSFCGTCYLWNSVSSCFCSAAIPLLIKSITWRHSIKIVNGMAIKTGYMSNKGILFSNERKQPLLLHLSWRVYSWLMLRRSSPNSQEYLEVLESGSNPQRPTRLRLEQ